MPTATETYSSAQPPPKAEPGLDELAVVAVLDGFGILVTVVAAVVVGIGGEDVRGWWVAVGIASLMSVITTALFVRLLIRRRGPN